MSSKENTAPISDFTDLALDIATTLIASGAHSGRIVNNINRLALPWKYDVQMNITFNGVLLTVKDSTGGQESITRYKAIPPHNVHLALLTEFSRMTWNVADGDLSFIEAQQKTKAIKEKKSYNYWSVAFAVGFSCACLCLLAGGNLLNGCVAYLASFVGSIVRYHVVRLKFNPMISFVIASFVTTMIAGMDGIFSIGSFPEATLATSVLYLVPGVPLINSVIDLIEGYLSSAWNRALFGAFILLGIAVGMALSISLLGINHF